LLKDFCDPLLGYGGANRHSILRIIVSNQMTHAKRRVSKMIFVYFVFDAFVFFEFNP
jgi:hypothetical protein